MLQDEVPLQESLNSSRFRGLVNASSSESTDGVKNIQGSKDTLEQYLLQAATTIQTISNGYLFSLESQNTRKSNRFEQMRF